MRTPNVSDVFYTPGIVPEDPKLFRRFLEDELFKIQLVISALATGHISISTVAPAKPRAGDIRIADGTLWNPGGGQGVYWYTGSAWTKL